MNTPDAAPKEVGELLNFLCALGRVAHESYFDDRRITILETAGMVTLLREATRGIRGLERVPDELDKLTPEQTRRLTDIVAHHFHGLLPSQHEVIALAGLACLPNIVNFIQTIRNASALAAEFNTPAPRATPA